MSAAATGATPETEAPSRWGHAVNSMAAITAALEDPHIRMIEADVMVALDGTSIIMSHPPARESDLTLATFLCLIHEHNTATGCSLPPLSESGSGPQSGPPGSGFNSSADVHSSTPIPSTPTTPGRKSLIGIKLDFKDPEAVAPALVLLGKAWQLSAAQPAVVPVWLNADVLQGPGGGAPRFDADRFIGQCREAYPWATLSIGWTTGLGMLPTSYGYSAEHVDEMLALCRRHKLRHVTFPVRSVHAQQAPLQMQRLLEADINFTLTFWGEADRAVRAFIAAFEQSRVHVDVKSPDLPSTVLLSVFRGVGAIH